jgi:hypothetical protein
MVRPSDPHLGDSYKLFDSLIGEYTTFTEKKDGMQIRCVLRKFNETFTMSLYTHNDNIIVENATSPEEIKTDKKEWKNTIIKHFRENFDAYARLKKEVNISTIYFEGMLEKSPCKMGEQYDLDECGKVYAFEARNVGRVDFMSYVLFFREYNIPTVPILLHGHFGFEIIDEACEIIETTNIEGLIVQVNDQAFKLKSGKYDEGTWVEKLKAARLAGKAKQIADRLIQMRRNTGGVISERVDPSVLVDQLISKELTHGDWIERYKNETDRKQFVSDFVAAVSADEKLVRRRVIPMILERLK